jgi:hypothetical protein
MRKARLYMVLIAGLIFMSDASAQAAITEEEVINAQKEWAQGLVDIGKTYMGKGDYRKKASDHIDKLCAYQYGPVLFKPTKASFKQFRLTKEGALSYFTGGDKNYPEDKGFALHPWENVRFDNAKIIIMDNYAIAMGNYYFTPIGGLEEVKIEFSFGYLKDKDGKLRINLHHSSIPYGH